MPRAFALFAGLLGLGALWAAAGLWFGTAQQSTGLSCKAFCGLGLLTESLGLVDDARKVTGAPFAAAGVAACAFGFRLWRG